MSKTEIIAAPRISAKEICVAAVMAAFVFIATFVPQIPIPLGYAHLGDGAIFLAVFFAGRRAGIFAGAFGSALADLAGGFPVWLANWTLQTRYNGKFAYWQYSGSGSAEGITGAVDQDIRYILRPEQVTGLTAEKYGGGTILRWNKVPGALGYIILRGEPEGGGYTEIGRVTGAGSLSWIDRKGSSGYRYLVCAYIAQGSTEYRGAMSDPAETP